MWNTQAIFDVLAPHWRELGVISYSAIRIWQLKRRTRWLKRHSELTEQRLTERVFWQSNETLRIVSTAYAHGEPATLDDLLSSAERDWSLKSSSPPSATDDDEQTISRAPSAPRESSYIGPTKR